MSNRSTSEALRRPAWCCCGWGWGWGGGDGVEGVGNGGVGLGLRLGCVGGVERELRRGAIRCLLI